MKRIPQAIAAGPFQDSWESLAQYTVPLWFQDAKFGIFVHWGVYSVPAFANEWYPRNMYLAGTLEFEHHLETYGPHARFGYKDFVPLFRAEKYEPDAWASLFERAGARYVVPVAEHHDGFAMYDCSLSEWCAARMGPQRDVVGELAEAVRNRGLVFGLSSHRAEHWWYFNGGRKFDSDVQDPAYADLYGPAMPGPAPGTEEWKSKDWTPRPDTRFRGDWLARCCELVDKYRPQLVYFDWWIEQQAFEPYRRAFAAYYYNRGREWDRGVVINYKHQAFPEGIAVYDVERGQLADISPRFWQMDTSLSKNSWGYVENQDYKMPGQIVGDLVDIVSKNGCLLLNVGPRPDGTIPEPEQTMLLEIGEWLAINGEAIYGTRPWKVFGEGPTQVSGEAFSDTRRAAFTGEDIRFTTGGDALYAVALAWPGEQLTIKSLGTESPFWDGVVHSVDLLGHEGQLQWRRSEIGLTVWMPEQKPCEHAFALRIRGGDKWTQPR